MLAVPGVRYKTILRVYCAIIWKPVFKDCNNAPKHGVIYKGR